MLSSTKPEKNEARFAARLDVLAERVDTLGSAVATTASAIAKKDGEIASLRRDLQARDEAIQALATQARASSQAAADGAPLDANELRSLRNAVAALSKERADGAATTRIAHLAANVQTLAQRVEVLSAESTATPTAADPEVTHKLNALAAEVVSLKAAQAERSAEADRPSDELRAMLTTLRSQVEALATLRAGASGDDLAQHMAEVNEATERLSHRLDTLAASVGSAVTSLSDKEHELAASVDSAVTGLSDREHELAALHRHFTESSGRIESVAEDIRDALSVFPEPGAASVDELGAQVERVIARAEAVETASREAADAYERTAVDMARRIEAIEQRIATVATEVARAKALWPVALRSLEARLDDVASHARRPDVSHEPNPGDAPEAEETSPDESLLAGLRDSLEAMESVAAEMARASDVLEPAAQAHEPVREGHEPAADEAGDPVDHDEPVAAVGGTIIPLRSPDG